MAEATVGEKLAEALMPLIMLVMIGIALLVYLVNGIAIDFAALAISPGWAIAIYAVIAFAPLLYYIVWKVLK